MSLVALRGIAWGLPALAALVAVLTVPRRPRELGACLLGFTWGLATLPLVNALATRVGWWSFDPGGASWLGTPAEIVFGWALWWGPVALVLGRRVPLVLVVGFALLVDVLAMPRLDPLLVLHDPWWAGEALSLMVVLVPAQLLARWTWSDTRLDGRVALHLLQFALLIGFLLPDAVLTRTGGDWSRVTGLDGARGWIAAQLMGVLVLPGLAAVLEFRERGGGTPVPFDPPVRVVTSGPYAYVRNPMQVATALGFAALAAQLRSPGVLLIAVTAVVYGAGFAAWHEQSGELDERFGPAWAAWRAEVPAWIPRFRPHVARPAVLWVLAGCGPCEELSRWLVARAPVGLELRDAASHPEVLTRMRYEVPEDGFHDVGVGALARALEHLHLGWALVGFAARLPGVRTIAQVLVDASGGGPRPAR